MAATVILFPIQLALFWVSVLHPEYETRQECRWVMGVVAVVWIIGVAAELVAMA